eukprot:scaffold8205_cov167-Skeletonema_dohrnii-CCMP3373.AAC.2
MMLQPSRRGRTWFFDFLPLALAKVSYLAFSYCFRRASERISTLRCTERCFPFTIIRLQGISI